MVPHGAELGETCTLNPDGFGLPRRGGIVPGSYRYSRSVSGVTSVAKESSEPATSAVSRFRLRHSHVIPPITAAGIPTNIIASMK